MTPCPDESALLDLLEGLVSERRREELLAHVDGCAKCRGLIQAAEPRTRSAPDLTGPQTSAVDGSEGRPATALPPGSRVGRYVLLDRLGAGGMGVVYAAYDPELDRKIALKLIAPRLLGSVRVAEHRARLVREAQAMAQLHHPNVISVYDAGTFEGQVFLAMELFPAATVVLALTGGVLGGARMLSTAQDRLCAGAERKLAGIWDAPRKQVLRTALSTGRPYAEKVWTTVERELDRYTQAWIEEHTEACRATRVRGEQSDEILGMRMLCLDRERARLDTLSRVFAEPDAATRETAIQAVDALPDVRECADVRALYLRVVQPSSPEQAQQVSRARLELAEAATLQTAGKEPRALEIAQRVAETARTLGYPPLLAEALFLRGQLERARVDDRHVAERTLREAVIAAEEGRDDAAAARAWTELTLVAAAGAGVARSAGASGEALDAAQCLRRVCYRAPP